MRCSGAKGVSAVQRGDHRELLGAVPRWTEPPGPQAVTAREDPAPAGTGVPQARSTEDTKSQRSGPHEASDSALHRGQTGDGTMREASATPRGPRAGRPGGLCGQRAGAPGDAPGAGQAGRHARGRETEETLRGSHVIKQLPVNQFVTVAR